MASKAKNARRKPRTNSDGRMAHFDDQTAKDLEFDVVKTLLLNHCHNPTAVDRAKQLHPRVNHKLWRRELERTKEFLNLRTEGVPFPAVGGEEIAADNERLAVRDSVLDEAGFNRIRSATETVNGIIESLEDKAEGFPRLHELIDGIEANEELPKAIDSVFDTKGEVRSNASPKLIQIREEKVRLRRNLNRQFLKELKKNEERGWLADTKEGFINQRRVLAVNSTHKRKISGTALGQSKNASITFIEPASTVSLNFEMEMLQDDERKEIHRILRALTQQIRRFLPDLRSYHGLLVELDWARAKAQLAQEMDADLP
ncbi:MAG: DNA mismatch repair protein MutS, partial [Crocinitomicaceae bacterium]|nr:DNA mismatch repair protein MutS [Crocinitomicaceae bacterium]